MNEFKKIIPIFLKVHARIVVTVQNWPQVLLVKFGIIQKCDAIFVTGYRTRVDRGSFEEFMKRVNFFYQFPTGEIIDETLIKIPYQGRMIMLKFGKWGPIFTEVFGCEPYRKFLEHFDIRNRVVIDIGANIGDTAIYFALWGAKKVYAFEPFPGWYTLAQENISLNGLQHVCEVFGVGVAGSSGSLISDSTYKRLFSTDDTLDILIGGKTPAEELQLISLEQIVKKYDIKNAFMKMDCEGYEYDILLKSSDQILQKFDYMIIEYHYGYEELEKKLQSAGFSTWHSRPSKMIQRTKTDTKMMSIGYISAERQRG